MIIRWKMVLLHVPPPIGETHKLQEQQVKQQEPQFKEQEQQFKEQEQQFKEQEQQFKEQEQQFKQQFEHALEQQLAEQGQPET
ncbi:hypothetical protein PGT21_019517 [Puccinia graminis f. sp. tritici]|uniref:Uncharacterized protein n=1 Tax=Puccinia graminis f. sp. tritici TaxID=56615 RepID=A0A5B0LWQ2_PUCGR|nr:hypothetical protein PGT21_019517 [Puccinia graminis f. sp. tritici]